MTRRARTGAVAALTLVALTCLGACSAGAGDSSDAADTSSLTEDAQADAGAAAADEAAPTLTGRGTQAADRTPVAARAVIATATLSLHSHDVRATRNDVQQVTDALRGEVADEEADSDDGELVWTRLVLRVPTARFADAVTRIEGLAELASTERSTEDVTTQVIDNEVRIRAQERSLRRVEALLDRATRIADVVAIESELTRRQADLDSLKQQQAWLADQTSMSTITVHVERLATKAREEDRGVRLPQRAGLGLGRPQRCRVGAGHPRRGAAALAWWRLRCSGCRCLAGRDGRCRTGPRNGHGPAGPPAAPLSSSGYPWTNSVSRASWSGSVEGMTPWPRLKMWPLAARPASMISPARAVITSVGAKTRVGSRLPWTALSPTSGIASLQRGAPVDADHVGAGLAHQAEQVGGADAEVDPRDAELAGRGEHPRRSAASRARGSRPA